MRILFSARPAHGHLYPIVPLADAARRAGHEVHFATAGSFVATLRAQGFATHQVGLTLEQALAQLDVPGADGRPTGQDGRPDQAVGFRLFLDTFGRSTAADLAPLVAELRPDVMIYEQGDFGAPVVAGAAGIPAVLHSISPRTPQSSIDAFAGDLVTALWAQQGVANPPFDIFTGQVYLDIFPTVLQEPNVLSDPARTAMRPVPYRAPGGTAPGWLGTRQRPVVYLTLGTVMATDQMLRPAIDGLAALDADIVVALGSAAGDTLGVVPANVHVIPFVDQVALLACAHLVVHHGGSGTVLAALAAGTPQLLLPQGTDQFHNAARLSAAGLAAVLEPPAATPEAIATEALAEMHRSRPDSAVVRAELAAKPTPGQVLEHLTTRYGP